MTSWQSFWKIKFIDKPVSYFSALNVSVYFLFIFWLWHGVKKLAPCSTEKLARVSIIVAMRDEQEHAAACLTALVSQDYPADFLQIIIVDDASQDATPQILAEFASLYPQMKVVRQEPDSKVISRKKAALSRAIDEADGEILLFTDADCVPPPTWAKKIVSCFGADMGMVVGFSPVFDESNSWLGRVLAIDSLAAAAVAAGSIANGSATTCTGRNMAYRREVYDELNGFETIGHSVSGDDDLFLQHVHLETNWKIKFSAGSDGIVPSFQTTSLSEFFSQKRRHLSAGKYYNRRVQAGYLVFHLANFLLFLLFFGWLFFGQNILWSSLALAGKFAADFSLLNLARKRLHADIHLRDFFSWELFYLFYNCFIGPLSWVGKIRWK